jgi:hypothetical protein
MFDVDVLDFFGFESFLATFWTNWAIFSNHPVTLCTGVRYE